MSDSGQTLLAVTSDPPWLPNRGPTVIPPNPDGTGGAVIPANAQQVAGDHYRKHGALQHWDIVAHFDLDYFQGQITKYVMRHKDKGGITDLEKARHFLDKYIEVLKAKAATDPDANDGLGQRLCDARTARTTMNGPKLGTWADPDIPPADRSGS